jgi:hypothetical protein
VRRHLAPLLVALVVATGACGDDGAGDDAGPATTAPACATPGDRYPTIEAVEVRPAGDGTVDLAVTVSSPYDSPDRYADGWRVLGPDDEVLGVHELAHDHAAEQPFTRVQRGVTVPEGVAEVTVEGRDQCFGYGGGTRTVTVP